MKLVTAIVQPSRFELVKDMLFKSGIKGLTVTDAKGVGRQKGRTEVYRGHEYQVNLLTKVKIEIAVDDNEVERVVETILRGARSGDEGKIGDGKVFVTPISEVIRIRTGETGPEAL
jgi:nitrogen regulatory protein PII